MSGNAAPAVTAAPVANAPSKLYLVFVGFAILYIMICIGTAMGALSAAQTDTQKARKQGLVGFTFCLLGVLFGFVGFLTAPK